MAQLGRVEQRIFLSHASDGPRWGGLIEQEREVACQQLPMPSLAAGQGLGPVKALRDGVDGRR
jgi:hypothetical protein